MKVGLLFVCLVALIYAVSFSHSSTYDSLSYYKDIEMGNRFDLLHPHHLAFLPLQRVWYRLWQELGYDGRSAYALKVLSLMVSCLAVFAFSVLARRLIKATFAYVITLVSFAFAYLVWSFSTQGEPVPFFVLFTVLSLLVLIDVMAKEPRLKDACLLALVSGVGVLFHQELALVAPFVIFALCLKPRRSQLIATYLVLFGALVALPYLLAGKYLMRAGTTGGLVRWMTDYLHLFRGTQYGTLSNLRLSLIGRGLGGAFLGGMNLKPYLLWGKAKDAGFYLAALPFFLLGAYLLLGLAGALRGCGLRSWKYEDRLLAAFIVVFGAVGIWWGAHNRTFWTPVIVSLLVLVGRGYEWIAQRAKMRSLGTIVGVALVPCLIFGNLFGGILVRHHSYDDRAVVLMELFARAQPPDVVIVHDSRIYRLLDYYGHGLRVYAVVRGGRGKREPFLRMNLEARQAAIEALKSGNRVFVSSDAVGGDDFRKALGLPPDIDFTLESGFAYDDPFTGLTYTMHILRGRS